MTATDNDAPGRDWSTYAGMSAVAVAAAVLSFSALAGLAWLCGITAASAPLPGTGARVRLAWLLPIAVDAYAVTATRVWLRADADARTRAYARRNAVGAIGLSVAGNAVYHALSAAGITSLAELRGGWLVVVLVSAVPPVILGLVGHLHALVSAAPEPAPAGESAPAEPEADAPAPDAVPARSTGTPARRRTGTRHRGKAGTRTDAELTAVLADVPREPDGTVPVRRAAAALGCGPDRARRLLAAQGLLRSRPTEPVAALTGSAG